MNTEIPSNMQRIAKFMDENPSPRDCVKGHYYSIPCIKHKRLKKRDGTKRQWIPLIGPLHKDKEHINFDYWHIHVDTRFLFIDNDLDGRKALADPVCFSGSFSSNTLDDCYLDINNNAKLQVRRIKCHQANSFEFPHTSWTDELQAAYANSRVVRGMCPHRNIPVACGRRLGPGTQCPGHGLVWDDDGRLCMSQVHPMQAFFNRNIVRILPLKSKGGCQQ